jgi:Protein of unknown function (DUF2865)
MRNSSLPGVPVGIALLSLVLMVLVSQPVEAKGLLESIFGFLSPGKPDSSASRNSSTEAGYGRDRGRSSNPFHRVPGASRQSIPLSYGGRYKTVCVRLCDGYFFPISNSSRRQQFYDDAQQCQARCSSPTRLYYMSPRSPSIKTARDIRGFGYSKLKTAFSYRKALKPGCSCRPKPWSLSERHRHSRYALASSVNPFDQEGLVATSNTGYGTKTADAKTSPAPNTAATTTAVASNSGPDTALSPGVPLTDNRPRRRLIVTDASTRLGPKRIARRRTRRKVAQKSGWGFGAMGLTSSNGLLYPGDSR